MGIDANELETHRTALIGHCYRVLGSVVDAEDAVQETMVRAWRNLERFEGRLSLRTWLYRIATNVCFDALAARGRRARPVEEASVGTVDDALEERPRTHWLEPIPDALAVPGDASPLEQVMMRQSIRLAFVAALQHLPARQRVALLLADVLGWSAAEIGDCLTTSVPAVNSALQRARATLASKNVSVVDASLSDEVATLVDRYVDAFHRYDVDALVALMREDATLSMPPYTLWLQGPDAIRTWLLGRGQGAAARGSSASKPTGRPPLRSTARLVPTGGNGHGRSRSSRAVAGRSPPGTRSSTPTPCFRSSACRWQRPHIPS